MSAEDLAKRFAPILFLHPMEKFVPVDAKRFLENANLWLDTGAQPDSKAQWGVAGAAAGTRSPTVAAGGLSGVKTEPGKVIDDATLLGTLGTEVFLELGGWKDASETSEPKVTATSTNLYVDRKSIEDMYTKPGVLKDSKFRYHVELIEGAQFTRQLGMIAAPDMTMLKLPDHPALLLFYFFFPAHQQSVSSSICNDIKAKEAACHAGDWQCMAILLQGDPNGDARNYKPMFVGTTGFVAFPQGTTSTRLGYGFDAEDGYPAMGVARWRPATGPSASLPALEGSSDHAHLFVALGTHSLYTAPGTYDVLPYNDGPEWCGTFDNSTVMPEGWGQPDNTGDLFKGMGAFLAKVMGGFLVGGPLGEIAGVVAAAAEGYYPKPEGIGVVGTGDTPDPDQVPTAGAGMTIRPRGVNVAGVPSMLQDWNVQRNETIGQRHYDYVVNRDTQRFWPNFDGELGYQGRWGQRVTSDFLPRRAGPKFPNYFKMFMMGLAAGDKDHLFDKL